MDKDVESILTDPIRPYLWEFSIPDSTLIDAVNQDNDIFRLRCIKFEFIDNAELLLTFRDSEKCEIIKSIAIWRNKVKGVVESHKTNGRLELLNTKADPYLDISILNMYPKDMPRFTLDLEATNPVNLVTVFKYDTWIVDELGARNSEFTRCK